MEEIRTIDIFAYLRHRLTQQPLDFIALLISPFHALNVEAFVNELAEINPDVQGEIIIIPHLKHGIMVKNFYFLFKDHPNINFIVARPHAFERHDKRLFKSIIKNAQTSLLEIKKITRYPLKSVYFLSPLSHLSALNLCVGLFDVKLWKLYQPIFIAYDEGLGTYVSAKAKEEGYKKDLQDNQYKGLFTFWQAVNSIFSALSPQIQQLSQDNFFYITKRYLLDRQETKFKLNSHIINSFKKVLQKRAEKNPLNFTPVDVLFSTSPLEEYNFTSSLKADEFRQQVIKFFLEKDLTIGIKPHPAEKIEKYEKVLKKFPKEKVFLFSLSLIAEDILFQLPVKYVVSLCSTVLLTAKICDVVPIIIHPDLIGSNTYYHTGWEECKRVVEATVEGELNKGKKGGLAFFSWKKEGSLLLLKKVCTPLDPHIPNKKVAIVIVNYQCPLDTINCLQSIFSAAYKNFQIILIDNASKDNSIEIILEYLHKMGIDVYTDQEKFCFKPMTVVFIANQTNLGFAGGNNIGIRYALKCGADYIWLLNNDTIIDKDALIELIKLAEIDKKIGMVSSKLYCYHDPKKVQYNGEKVVYEGMEDVKGELPKPTNFATGCSLLMRRKFIENVGLLDEDYFLYFEDNDISTRALKAGWKVYYNPYSKIYHKGGASVGGWLKTPLSVYYATRNLLLYCYKHDGSKISEIFGSLKCQIFPQLNGDRKKIYAFSQGIEDFIFNKKGKTDIDFKNISEVIKKIEREKSEIEESLKNLFEIGTKEKFYLIKNAFILKSDEYLNKFFNLARVLFLKESYKKDKKEVDYYHQAEALYNNGQEAEAIKLFKKTLELSPNFALAHNNLAFIYWQKQDVGKALHHIIKAMEISPDDRDIIWNCGQIMLGLGYAKDAYKVYKSYLKRHPEEKEIRQVVEELEKGQIF